MKVLHVVDSLRVGGSESLAATLAGSFLRRSADGVVCGLGVDGPLRERLDAFGILSMNLGAPLGVRPGLMARLGWLMLKHRCDAVLTHHFRQLLHAVPGATLLGRRLVHVEHDFHSYEDRPDIVRKFGKLAPYVSRFVFVSGEIRDWFADRVPSAAKKFTAIPNGVDTFRFRPDPEAGARMRAEIGAEPGDFVVGTCARLEPIKNLDLLVQGFCRMREQGPTPGRNAHLVLVGAGSLRADLEQSAARAGVRDRVHFPGVVDNVPYWLNGFDAYAITSLNEGLPLSVLEAMSCGLPVVSVDVGSISRAVDAEVGFLLEGGSPEELGARLFELDQCPEKRLGLGRAARSRITTRHSLDAMIQSYMHVLQGMPTQGDVS